jgi:hypothetical protein
MCRLVLCYYKQLELEKDMKADSVKENDILLNISNSDCTEQDRLEREKMRKDPVAYFKEKEAKRKAEKNAKLEQLKKAKDVEKRQRERAKQELTASRDRIDFVSMGASDEAWRTCLGTGRTSILGNASSSLTKEAVYQIIKNDFVRKKQPELVSDTLVKYIKGVSGVDIEKETVLTLINDPECIENLDGITDFLNTLINTSIIACSSSVSLSKPLSTGGNILSALTTPQDAIRSALLTASSTPPASTVRKTILTDKNTDNFAASVTDGPEEPKAATRITSGGTKRSFEDVLGEEEALSDRPPAKKKPVSEAKAQDTECPAKRGPLDIKAAPSCTPGSTSLSEQKKKKPSKGKNADDGISTPGSAALTPATAPDRRNAFQKSLHKITSSPTKFESEPFYWAVLLNNVLEATKTRHFAIVDVQFGRAMKDPSQSIPVISQLCLDVVKSNLQEALGQFFLKLYPVSVAEAASDGKSDTGGTKVTNLNEDAMRAGINNYLSQHNIVDILSSISGITSPKDKTSDLIGFFRDACLTELRKAIPDLAKDPSRFTQLRDALKAPRMNFGADGVAWKSYCLSVSLKCLHEKYRSSIQGNNRRFQLTSKTMVTSGAPKVVRSAPSVNSCKSSK